MFVPFWGDLASIAELAVEEVLEEAHRAEVMLQECFGRDCVGNGDCRARGITLW